MLALALPVSGCGTSSLGSSVVTGDLPIDDDFSGDCHWAQDDSGGAEVGCVDGAYRITVHDPSANYHQTVPTRFGPVDDLIVETDVTLTALPTLGKRDYAYYGVNCTVTGAGQPARGYASSSSRPTAGPACSDTTRPTRRSRTASIEEPARRPARPRPRRQPAHRARPRGMRFSGAGTTLTLQIDGVEKVRVGDKNGSGPFRSAGLDMFTTLAGTTVEYDNVHISSATT